MLVALSLILALSGVAASSALGTRAEEQQGAALLRDFQAGGQSCGNLSSTQFELIGEYLMARIIGSPAAHDAMNARIKQMMGAKGEAQAHIYLAQRTMGCARGAAPASYGQMMGIAGPMMHAGGASGSGMMAGGSTGLAAGSMVGGNGHHSASGWSSGMIVLTVLLGLGLLAALIAAIVLLSRKRDGAAAAKDVLDRRLADGEIDVEEYERRRRALDGPPTGQGPVAT